jgi:hydrogenase expression/formation protein HypE
MGTDPKSLLSCPMPLEHGDIVQMAHGGGGRKTSALVEGLFLPAFRNDLLEPLADGAVLPLEGGRIAVSTDSFVVRPIFFPGGDIGSLAIHGTANDLAMCGAEPILFTAALILEEGFPMADLRRIVESMADAARRAGAPIVTGDTKVVDRGKGDGIYVNTTGVGRVRPGIDVGPRNARPGDAILVSGPIGDHGIAVMVRREGIELETALRSDSGLVGPAVRALLDAVPETRVLRDPTRGGLATALVEVAGSAGVAVEIRERDVPVRPEVRGASELLGFDPLYVACEGRFVAFVPGEKADMALAAIRSTEAGKDAALVGRVTEGEPGRVVLVTSIGSRRIVEKLSGEQLPRIC